MLGENKEIDSVLSETLNNTDSDAELERELAELLEEDNVDVFSAVPDSNPEIEKLEQRLQDLRMEGKYCKIYCYISYKVTECYILYKICDTGLVSTDKGAAVPSNKAKTLKKPECL